MKFVTDTNIVLIFTILIFFLGCSNKTIFLNKSQDIKEPKLITMKTKKFAFSDSGFYINDKDKIVLQVYSSGVVSEKRSS